MYLVSVNHVKWSNFALDILYQVTSYGDFHLSLVLLFTVIFNWSENNVKAVLQSSFAFKF